MHILQLPVLPCPLVSTMTDISAFLNFTSSNPLLRLLLSENSNRNSAITSQDVDLNFAARITAALRLLDEESRKVHLEQQLVAALQQQQNANNYALALFLQEQQQQLQALASVSSIASGNANNCSSSFGAPILAGRILNPASADLPSFSTIASPSTLSPSVSSTTLTNAASDEATVALLTAANRKGKGRSGTFPQKLYQMLSDLEAQPDLADVASFLPHGRAFSIHKPRDFCKYVMPKYFRMSRFSSFQRQLNLYEFHRITDGPDKGAYAHELFQKGRPILSTMMRRNKIKGVKHQQQQAVGMVHDSNSSAMDSASDSNGTARSKI